MKRFIVACALGLCGFARIANAQGLAGDALYLTGQAEFVQSWNGAGGGVEWLHAVTPESALDLGAFSGSVADMWWAYGRLGGSRRWRGTGLSGAVDIGGGEQGRQRFAYRRLRGDLVVPIRSSGVFVESEGQYLAVGSTPQHVLRAGVGVRLSREAMARASYYLVLSAGASRPFVSGRVDLNAGRIGILAGLMVGRGTRGTPPLPEVGAVPTASREFFAGCRLPAGSYELLWTFDLVHQPARRAGRLLLGLRIPLSSRAPENRAANRSPGI